MSELLPHSVSLDSDNNWAAIHLSMAYRPHTPVPSRLEVMEGKYELEGHCSLKGLCEQIGVEYKGRQD